MATSPTKSKADSTTQLARQAERLSLLAQHSQNENSRTTAAVEAKFVTLLDPVVQTANGGRLPAVPVEEARKLNQLKDEVEQDSVNGSTALGDVGQERQQDNAVFAQEDSSNSTLGGPEYGNSSDSLTKPEASLYTALPPSRTNPLFPPLPLYGPPTLMRNLHCTLFRISSFFLSLSFLGVIVLGSVFTSIPLMFRHVGLRLTFRDPNARRPFHTAEKRRKNIRREKAKAWKHRRRRRSSITRAIDSCEEGTNSDFEPTEGGKDPLVCDVAYYARRVGLDVEEFKVLTEDGFIITLWHVYHPKEYASASCEHRAYKQPEVFPEGHIAAGQTHGASGSQFRNGNKRYPVLLVHGLLQSAGAYCCNDDDSLAFYLCKRYELGSTLDLKRLTRNSGYDVWLGNNRCGFEPQHQLLKYSDPRMWAWNIRQMGVMDLPALISRVLSETGFEKLGLVCHSQGTTETFVALAKEQRPDLGSKISVFCALAPAVYAGPLIGKMYLKFMRIISTDMFRVFFGIHAFIPFMMTMHSLLPGKIYGALGYRVFSFLFNWTDDRWDQGLRDRFFQFAPVYVSAESMRWWLGRECFATQKCILATREEGQQEDEEDEEENDYVHNRDHPAELPNDDSKGSANRSIGRTAWYDEQVPPMALWIGGRDELVDGRRLLRRFERGREPFVRIVHAKVVQEYEHLDFLWAMNAKSKVFEELNLLLYSTISSLKVTKTNPTTQVENRVTGVSEHVQNTQGMRRGRGMEGSKELKRLLHVDTYLYIPIHTRRRTKLHKLKPNRLHKSLSAIYPRHNRSFAMDILPKPSHPSSRRFIVRALSSLRATRCSSVL